jgi:hypothetical protein
MATADEQKWIEAWRYAGPELERIRLRELQQMKQCEGAPSPIDRDDQRCGLEDFQQWMMRWRVKLLMQNKSAGDA